MLFLDEISLKGGMQEYSFDLNVSSEKLVSTDTMKVAVISESGEPINAEMYVTNGEINKTLLSFGRQEYYIRIYKDHTPSLNFCLKILPKATRKINAIFWLNPKAENFDSVGKTGDYIEKKHINCYESEKLNNPMGVSISFISKSSEFNVYVNPDVLPEKTEDFAYKFLKGEIVEVAASTNSIGINIPLLPFQISQNGPTYYCIEAKDTSMAYAIGYSQWIPFYLQPGQKQRIYIHDQHPQMAFIHMPRYRPTALQMHIQVIEGCVNVLAKQRLSFYQGYSLGEKLTQGDSPFSNLGEEDNVWEKMQPEHGNIVKQLQEPSLEGECTGNDIYISCPSFFFFENCEKNKSSNSTIMMKISNQNEVQIIPGDRLIAKIQKTKQFFMIPNVPPLASSVKIRLSVSSLTSEQVLGIVSVSRNSVVTDLTKGEKFIKLTNLTKKVVINFTRQNDGNLEGNYFITVEGHTDFNIKFSSKIIDELGSEKRYLQNIKNLPSKEIFQLTPLNLTHQIGYFTFFLNNTDLTGKSNKHDVLITALPLKEILGINFIMSTKNWADRANYSGPIWTGETLRLSAKDSNYTENSFYYILAHGFSPMRDDDEDIEPRNGIFSFTIIQEKKAKNIILKKKYTLGRSMLLKYLVQEKGDYVIKKKSDTAETVYISISPENHIPFSDMYDSIIENQMKEEDFEETIEAEKMIKHEELIGKNKGCLNLNNKSEDCPIYVYIFCHQPRCLYEISVEPIVEQKSDVINSNKTEKAQDKKIDL